MGLIWGWLVCPGRRARSPRLASPACWAPLPSLGWKLPNCSSACGGLGEVEGTGKWVAAVVDSWWWRDEEAPLAHAPRESCSRCAFGLGGWVAPDWFDRLQRKRNGQDVPTRVGHKSHPTRSGPALRPCLLPSLPRDFHLPRGSAQWHGQYDTSSWPLYNKYGICYGNQFPVKTMETRTWIVRSRSDGYG